MNEIIQMLDSIIAYCEDTASACRSLKDKLQKETAKVTETTNEKKEEPEKKYTFAEVRKAFSSMSHAGHTAKVKALINKYGAARLSDIKEEDYPALMKELEVIGNA